MVLLNKKHPPKTNSHSGRTSWSPGSVYSSKKENEKKGITKQSFWKLNSDGVKGKANLLHTRQQEPQSQQLPKNTNTPLDLWCSSALAAFTPVQPAQSYARWSPWIRQCTANSKLASLYLQQQNPTCPMSTVG